MSPGRRALIGIACAALLASPPAHADATVVFLQGDVRDEGEPVAQGRRVLPGRTLATGPGAQAHLQFSDRQRIVLGQETAFRIAEFHYAAHAPQSDRASFDLLYGAVRFISGAVGARSPGAVALRTPQATFSVRGTDFVVVVANWAYLKVLKGGVGVTNAGGTVVFGENTAAVVTSSSEAATPVFAASLPPAASGPISSLAAAELSTPTAAATGAATGEVPALRIDARTAIKIGVYGALIGAALQGTGSTSHH